MFKNTKNESFWQVFFGIFGELCNKHSRFAKAGVWCFYESLVQGSNSVFQLNICAENPPLRKAENR